MPKSKTRFSIVATKEQWDDLRDSTNTKAEMLLKKVHGGSTGIPSPFTYTQCMWTFIGVIMMHTIVSQVGLLVHTASEGDLSLLLPPTGTFFFKNMIKKKFDFDKKIKLNYIYS
jgi:hypothetical protein